MKTPLRSIPNRELNIVSGIALGVIGAGMLSLCYMADGHLRAFPALLGHAFLIMAALMVLTSLRRHRKQPVKTRPSRQAPPSRHGTKHAGFTG